jgi:hypothetical protein
MSYYYDSCYPILQDISESYPLSLGNEALTRPSHGCVQFAPIHDMQRPETSSIYSTPWKDLVPIGVYSRSMQNMDFNHLAADQTWPRQSTWPVTQANYENPAKPPKCTDKEKDMSCVIDNLIQLENRLRNHTQQQLAEIKCSFHSSS